MRRIAAGLLAFLPVCAQAQQGSVLDDQFHRIPMNAPNGVPMLDGAGSLGGQVVGGRSLTARAGDVFNPRDYGAVGDGNSHLFGGTAAQLFARFPWANDSQHGTLFNLPVSAPAVVGATTLSFAATQTVSTAAAVGSTTLLLGDVGGLSQGMTITLAGVPTGAQVDWVNPATLQIGLSAATTGTIAANASASFVHSWLPRVVVGMQASGPGVPAGATVTAVSSTGVTLSAGLTGAVVAPTSNTAATPQYQGTAITFRAPFTDAQAAALQMDALGLQAAALAASAAGGGLVRLPANTAPGAAYLLDQTIVFPTSVPGGTEVAVSLIGEGRAGTRLTVVSDLGPKRYALSCGDPTATAANGRGIYGGAGQYCYGAWRGVTVTLQGSNLPGFGRRPQVAGVPVAMSGVKQGPRRAMGDILVSGFNVGSEYQGDHTAWDSNTWLTGNFAGLRFDDPMSGTFGDYSFTGLHAGGNGWAGLSVSPTAYIGAAKFDEAWFGDQPYPWWIEPGLPLPVVPTFNGVLADTVNFEGAGCGTIVDGNVQANGTIPAAWQRGMLTVHLRAPHFSAFPGSYGLPGGGCPWRSYIDLGFAYGLHITEIPESSFAPVAGGVATIRVRRTTDYADNRGGLLLSGDGMKNIMDADAAAGQEVVSDTPNPGQDFLYSRAATAIRIEVPGVGSYKEYFFNPGDAAPLAMGTLLEAAPISIFAMAQRSGTATANTAPLLGTVPSPYNASMAGKWVPVMVEGQTMPILVSAAQNPAGSLQLDTANPGKATAAATLTTGRVIGFVTDPNGGSASQVFMQGQFGRGGP